MSILKSSMMTMQVVLPCHVLTMMGADNSNRAQGKFYEGYMVTGTTTDATDELVQANIIGVGYKNV